MADAQRDAASSRTSARKPRRRTDSLGTGSGPRDYVAIAVKYAEEAVADKGRKRFGKWVRLAARRFLDDLKRARAKGAPFAFDEWHAVDACSFIEKLPHVEGRWKDAKGNDAPYIIMHPAHVFFVVNLFGFRKGKDGTRRFSTALLAIARKNAKSTLAAGILLYCLCCEGEVGPQVISAATTGDQARVVFNVAKRMVELTPDLREAFGLEPLANSVASWQSGGSFKPINAKASTQDGLNPSHTSLDEIHAHKNHDLLNVLRSAAGARANALWLFMTTEGYETPGPWPEIRQFARVVLEGVVQADHFFAVIYALDDQEGEPGERGYRPADKDFDESKWVKANPLIEVNPVLLEKIREAAVEAKQMPGMLAEFRIKRLNRRSATAKGVIKLQQWLACAKPVDLKAMRGAECWGALDLASTTDLCSMRLLWKIDDHFFTWGRRWVCEDAVAQRTLRGTVPYAAWIGAGYLEQTPGEVVDHDVIHDAVLEANAEHKPKSWQFDEWNAKQLVAKWREAGLPMEQFIQGPKSYHPATQEFERAYLQGLLSYGTDPVLTWCAANLIWRFDANLNRAPDKKKAPDKIDDIVALLMCFGGVVLSIGQASKGWEVVTA